MEFLFFPVFFIFIAVIIGLSLVHQRNQMKVWKQLATDLGLESSPSSMWTPPTMRGSRDGIPVKVKTITKGSGKSKKTYTQFSCTIRAPMPDGIQVNREGFGAWLGKMFGSQDIQIGDPAFDAQFMIKGRDPSAVKRMLSNPRVQMAIGEVVTARGEGWIRENQAFIEIRGFCTARATFDVHLGALTRMAAILNAEAGLEGPSDEPQPDMDVDAFFSGKASSDNPQPAPSPTPPVSTAEAPPVSDIRLSLLADPALASGDRAELLQELKEEVFELQFLVRAVYRTRNSTLPGPLASGHTAVGTAEGLNLCVLYPNPRSQEIREIPNGTVTSTNARVMFWNDLDQQLVFEAV